MLGEQGSGMFSKFCFGVRLRGDRASINFAEHLGSLKPERALQFINLNLLTLQLEKTSRKLWQDTDVPHSAAITHTREAAQLHPDFLSHPLTPTAVCLVPCIFCLLCKCLDSTEQQKHVSLLGILWATLLAPESSSIFSHWPWAPGETFNLIHVCVLNTEMERVFRTRSSQQCCPASAVLQASRRVMIVPSLF